MSHPRNVVVAGIDTDAGKTLCAALLCLHLDADYWKPVQAGAEPATDTETVRAWTERPPERFHPETYCLKMPASPHASAAAEGIRIDAAALAPPETERPLVIETAGGLMVPLTEDFLVADLLEKWRYPVVLVVRTYLGSINHSLLSLEALARRGIPLAGIVFNDGGRPESEGVIERYANAPVLARIPVLERIDRAALAAIPVRKMF